MLIEQAMFTVLRWPYNPDDDADVPRLLRDLVTRIDATVRDATSYCSIVSTNYDIAVEYEVYRRLRAQGISVEQRVDFGFSWREVDDPGPIQHRPAQPALSVLKLHGACNWLKCELCGYIYVNTWGAIYRLAYQEEPSAENTCHCGHSILRAVAVAPSLVRDIREQALLAVWTAALEALRTADEWILIGYSLPPEDIAIRSLLIRAYNARDTKPRVRVFQGPDSDDEEARYQLFFEPCEYSRGGLQGFIDS